jgi:hypothetical protein
MGYCDSVHHVTHQRCLKLPGHKSNHVAYHAEWDDAHALRDPDVLCDECGTTEPDCEC